MIITKFFQIFLLLHLSFFCLSPVFASQRDHEVIVEVTERFFIYLKDKKYQQVFELLTTKSTRTIVKDVAKSISKTSKASIEEEEIFLDFRSGGPLAKAYWDAFAHQCDPDLALKESTWKVGKLKDNYGEVIVKYKTAEKPATIRLYKEEGTWRLGLVESFWARK